MRLAAAFFIASLAAECVHTPAPAPLGDAAPPQAMDAGTASCAIACANLARLACPEGTATNCAATCDHAAGLTNMHVDCLANAKTKDDARLCHSVSCQ